MSFFLLLNKKEDILKNNGQLMDPIDFHSRTKNTMEVDKNTIEVNGVQQLFGSFVSETT